MGSNRVGSTLKGLALCWGSMYFQEDGRERDSTTLQMKNLQKSTFLRKIFFPGALASSSLTFPILSLDIYTELQLTQANSQGIARYL